MYGFGANNARPVVQTCPHCSYLWDSKCVICEDGDPHPGCEDCEGGRPTPIPWYKTEFVASVVSSAIVAVISAFVFVKLSGASMGSYSPNRRRRLT